MFDNYSEIKVAKYSNLDQQYQDIYLHKSNIKNYVKKIEKYSTVCMKSPLSSQKLYSIHIVRDYRKFPFKITGLHPLLTQCYPLGFQEIRASFHDLVSNTY